MKLYQQLQVATNHPEISDWYPTDKGNLFYFVEEKEWSSRDDKVSVEYPNVWYKGGRGSSTRFTTLL